MLTSISENRSKINAVFTAPLESDVEVTYLTYRVHIHDGLPSIQAVRCPSPDPYFLAASHRHAESPLSAWLNDLLFISSLKNTLSLNSVRRRFMKRRQTVTLGDIGMGNSYHRNPGEKLSPLFSHSRLREKKVFSLS